MGGKSRKSGEVSRKLIERLKQRTGEKSCGRKNKKGEGGLSLFQSDTK